MINRAIVTLGTVALTLAVWATEAAAHHPMGGMTPTTFWHGFLSGLGHPVIGLDHLAALVAAACIAATQRNALGLAVTYVLLLLAGAAVHVLGLDVPAAEALAALAVIALGAVLIWPGALAAPAVLALFAFGGLVHGYVLGESIVGAEPAPLAAYFVGLGLVQAAIAAGTIWLVRRVFAPAAAAPMPLRATGAAVALLGAWFLIQGIPGAA